MVAKLCDSEFSHAAIYVGDGELIEGGPAGVHRAKLFETGTHFALVRPQYKDEQARQKAVGYAEKAIGKEYDWLNHPSEDKLHCLEVVSNSAEAGGVNLDLPVDELLPGVSYMRPADVLRAKNVKVLESEPYQAKSLLKNLPAAAVAVGAVVAGAALGGVIGGVAGLGLVDTAFRFLPKVLKKND